MNFNLDEAIELLERTPEALAYFLSGLSEGWVTCNEGEGTWNASEVIGHLIIGEKYNWIPRMESILNSDEPKLFPVFDRFAHLKENQEDTIGDKLHEFKKLRKGSLDKLKSFQNLESHYEKTGIHPEHGEVRLKELLSTWVVHDLTHITQIARIMAERYREDVGPWVNYLGVLRRNTK